MQDVHDRALFYYRVLQHNVFVAERVVNPPKQAVSVFADTQSSENKDRIFDEFNSLSAVYQKVTAVDNLLTIICFIFHIYGTTMASPPFKHGVNSDIIISLVHSASLLVKKCIAKNIGTH